MARRAKRIQTSTAPRAADAFTLAADPRPRPAFSICPAEQRAFLLARAMDLLAEHGVALIHDAARATMLEAGAAPGREAAQVRLPREMVREAIAAAPKAVTLAGKRPDRDAHLPRADHGFIMRTGTGAHGFVEPDGRYRNMDISDVARIAALANGLDQVGFVAHPFSYGVHELTSDIHGVAELVCATDKHIWLQPYNVENVEYLVRIVTVAAGGEAELRARPIASTIMCSFSPLEFKVMDVEALIQSGRAGLPVHACSLPSAGGTAPLSVAGNALMAVAEILAMVTLAHVLTPGTAVIATPLMFTLDMATGQALHACPESLQAKALAIGVLKHEAGLICHTYGAGSDTPDAGRQSMAERAMLGQMVALAGADILGGVGQLETATVFSPVQAVLDDELGAYLRALIATPRVDDAALNWDEAREIGIGAHFLASPHTLAGCRDQYRPAVFRRQGRDDYDKGGRRGAWEEARDKALRLMAAPPPPGLPDADARAEIARIVAAADADIIGKAQEVSGRREVI
ncbi:trimethylamine methyltransferase family protein [Jhaorihella thermophila]|uniref:Trimethylamine:corrinoid methyltransferase n=1 Tax=Jhaorihella thermophila TaxID=488547 RepID=A0A1H5XWU7_9RHOB|nr:trimethylamine methyltransferase family protein [Jhaorihella thermophila]SEG15860.1 Trimethylamine:corrinoid methyltransferase [Jhaorihella thermophila]